MFDVILTHLRNLNFCFLNIAITSVSTNCSSYTILTSLCKKVAAPGLGASRRSLKVAWRCLGLLVTGEDAICLTVCPMGFGLALEFHSKS